MATSLYSFLQSHRTAKDASDWNITGMSKNDAGKYRVDDDEYDAFLGLLNKHIFGPTPYASALLERHREVGPPLVDLDFRYEPGGPLSRKYTPEMIKEFIASYVAAMVYLSKVENLPQDLVFYHLEKPAPENDKSNHKDGVHIECTTLTTSPKYQYGIRGFLLMREIIQRIFGGPSGISNTPEDCYDVSVISRNNWFFYGACKPDKAQYKVVNVWTISIAEIAESLDGGDPTDFNELTEIISELMTPTAAPTNTLDLIKTLSIRRNHTVSNQPSIRQVRATEWEELMIHWGSGKAKLERALLRNTVDHELVVAAGGAGDDVGGDTPLVFGEPEESRRITSALTPEDITLLHRLGRDCLNAERRAGEYHDWINLAICLKNIANTNESFAVWCDVTRRVNPTHKKANYTEAQMRAKWALVRVDESKKLYKGSLHHWARVDNPERYRSIVSESNTSWIINNAKDTHVNVATFVFRMYEHEFRCSVGASRKGPYEWYYYPPSGHTWKHMRTNTELRARLSGLVKNEYVTAGQELSRLHNAPENLDNTTERERIDEKRKKLFVIERQLEMATFKDNIIRECQEKFYDEEFIHRLNTNPYLVGVGNGVLELRHYDGDEGVGRPRVYFRPGQPDDNISFQMGRGDPGMEAIPYVPYNAEDPIQRELEGFFRRIYPDPVLFKYVLTLLSSCLEGANKEQKFYVMQGVGSNGKSMIEKLMEWTFGDYGTSLGTQVFTRKRPESGQANADIITVKCRRYIHMGEPDDNEKINTSIMKQYSGGDAVQARGLFSDQEKFSIMGKIFMSCNDLPPVSKMDNGTWRRIRVIPHVALFKDPSDPMIDPSKHIYEKDEFLEDKLKLHTWRTGFLSLLVHYYDTEYLVHGLREPDCVTAASNKYKEINDMFMSFFTDTYVREPGAGPVSAKDVKTSFRDWKRAFGKVCDLKDHQVLERLKLECGGGSTEKEFWGIREITEDLSGALMP